MKVANDKFYLGQPTCENEENNWNHAMEGKWKEENIRKWSHVTESEGKKT